jgi:formamidopyrimidine-DNA glycosylase
MPELPDITVYIEALAPRVLNQPLIGLRITSPFVLRSVDPPPAELAGRRVTGLERMGKRIVFGFEGDLYLVLHLMIAGRLKWLGPAAPVPKKVGRRRSTSPPARCSSLKQAPSDGPRFTWCGGSKAWRHTPGADWKCWRARWPDSPKR